MDLRAQLEERLAALRQELAAGRRLLEDLEAQRTEVLDRMLRISGAVQVLEEELAAAPDVEQLPAQRPIRTTPA